MSVAEKNASGPAPAPATTVIPTTDTLRFAAAVTHPKGRETLSEALEYIGQRAKYIWPAAGAGVDACVFRAVSKLHEATDYITPMAIAAYLAADPSDAVVRERADDIARLIMQLSDSARRDPAREVMAASERLVRAYAARVIADTIVNSDKCGDHQDLAQRITEIAEELPSDKPDTWDEDLADIDNPDRPARANISTGFANFDDVIGKGFGIGEQTIIAAGTSVGKSTIAGALARNVLWPASVNGFERKNKRPARSFFDQGEPSEEGEDDCVPLRVTDEESNALRQRANAQRFYDTRVLIIATESPRKSYLQRFQQDLFDCTREDLDDLGRRKEVFEDRFAVRARFMQALKHPSRPLEILDRKALGNRQLSSIVRAVREWATRQRNSVKEGEPTPKLLVLVDYLQKVGVPSDVAKATRQVQLAHVSDTLCQMAVKLDVALVCLAMLNGRIGFATAENASIREAADIENDADMVIAVDVVAPKMLPALKQLGTDGEQIERAARTMKLIVVKGRNTGTTEGSGVLLDFDKKHQRLSMLTPEHKRTIAHMDGDPIAWARRTTGEVEDSAGAKPKRRKKKKADDGDVGDP